MTITTTSWEGWSYSRGLAPTPQQAGNGFAGACFVVIPCGRTCQEISRRQPRFRQGAEHTALPTQQQAQLGLWRNQAKVHAEPDRGISV